MQIKTLFFVLLISFCFINAFTFKSYKAAKNPYMKNPDPKIEPFKTSAPYKVIYIGKKEKEK
jgi:hypothetical protein